MLRFMERSQGKSRRQIGLGVVLALALSACTAAEEETSGEIGSVGYVTGFLGGVSADEPRAALVGRDVLASGGSAADAAVAMYFTLAVTKPSAASLGGGGICVVHDQEANTTEALSFLAGAPDVIPQGATRPSAVPGNPRGFFALHARYGVLRWEQLVGPAANLARFGMPVSRSMAADFRAAESALVEDSEMLRAFGKTSRSLVGEGDSLAQTDLAIVLSRMVARGPGEFYTGVYAAQFVDAVNAAGGSLDLESLRRFRPVWQKTVSMPLGLNAMHVPPPPAAAGTVAAVMMKYLESENRFAEATPALQAHLLAEAALRAYGDRGRWLLADGTSTLSPEELGDPERFLADMNDYDPARHAKPSDIASRPVARQENPAGTSFFAVDRRGNAVACGLTMNNFFGTGRIAPGTGIVLATIPGDAGRGPLSLTPMIVANENNGALFWVGSATGGVAAPTALANVAARTLLAREPLAQALQTARVHHGGLPDLTYVEDRAPDEWTESLSAKGHDVSAAGEIGRVNVFSCPDGLDENRKDCEIFTDPRGFGLAIASDGS